MIFFYRRALDRWAPCKAADAPRVPKEEARFYSPFHTLPSDLEGATLDQLAMIYPEPKA